MITLTLAMIGTLLAAPDTVLQAQVACPDIGSLAAYEWFEQHEAPEPITAMAIMQGGCIILEKGQVVDRVEKSPYLYIIGVLLNEKWWVTHEEAFTDPKNIRDA